VSLADCGTATPQLGGVSERVKMKTRLKLVFSLDLSEGVAVLATILMKIFGAGS
jgi:hypothetical protein